MREGPVATQRVGMVPRSGGTCIWFLSLLPLPEWRRGSCQQDSSFEVGRCACGASGRSDSLRMGALAYHCPGTPAFRPAPTRRTSHAFPVPPMTVAAGETRRVSGIARCVQALFLPAGTSPFDGAGSGFCPSSQLRGEGRFVHFVSSHFGGRHPSARHRTPTSTGMRVFSRPSFGRGTVTSVRGGWAGSGNRWGRSRSLVRRGTFSAHIQGKSPNPLSAQWSGYVKKSRTPSCCPLGVDTGGTLMTQNANPPGRCELD